jgi:hypothetical protein
MKHLRLVALILATAAWCAAAAYACDDSKGASASAANAKDDCSAHAGTSATAASSSGGARCAMHGASAAASCDRAAHASAMAKGTGCCMGTASAMAANGHCEAKAMAHNADCSVCLDEATCDNDLRSAGVRSQVVSLRNGAMIVYTAESPAAVRSLQATVARYNDRIMSDYANGSDVKLCGECKAFRGAMASGKFTRELVNVHDGCQILLTSTDRSIVQRIHDMTNAQMAARVKS